MVYKLVVEHLNNIVKWDALQINDPKTMIIGSFNPYNPNLKISTDFYYGRIQNRFWSTIGNLKYQNKDHFKYSIKNKIDELQSSSIIFMDLIESLEFQCDDIVYLEKYIAEKVFGNYGDNDIWVSKTRSEPQIKLKRNYNYEILEFLSHNSSVKRIVNTLGKNRGDLGNFNKRDKDWVEFKKSLFEISSQKDIEVVKESVSPSPLGGAQSELNSWVKNFILK